jgi:thioredoxin 1
MSETKPATLTRENFERVVLDSSQPVLVDFWADWCAPCRVVGPWVEEIARDFEGRAVVGKVDVDEQLELAREYGIRSIPALLVFRNGEVTERIVGAVPKQTLTEALDGASL